MRKKLYIDPFTCFSEQEESDQCDSVEDIPKQNQIYEGIIVFT